MKDDLRVIDDEVRDAWANNTPPPTDESDKFDFEVTIHMDPSGIQVTGIVHWEPDLAQYIFQIAEKLEDGGWETYVCAAPEDLYISIRAKLRDDINIFVTRGLDVASEVELAIANALVSFGGYGTA